MSITAKSVSKAMLAVRETDENIKSILEAIDTLISEFPAEIGLNKLKYNLPSTFTNMMTNTSSGNVMIQIMIYGQVCKSLIERGFKVAIVLPAKGNNCIFVSWVATLENDLYDKCKKILSDHKFTSEADAVKSLELNDTN